MRPKASLAAVRHSALGASPGVVDDDARVVDSCRGSGVAGSTPDTPHEPVETPASPRMSATNLHRPNATHAASVPSRGRRRRAIPTFLRRTGAIAGRSARSGRGRTMNRSRHPEGRTLSRSRWGLRLLFAALICAVLAGSGLGSTASAQALIDYDSDDDGLIEVTTEAQLNAIRWDLDGSGVVDASGNATSYSAAFPTAAPQMGCPSAACAGYELAGDISLTSNTGMGWAPIGDGSTGTPPSFGATFEGNGHTISDLFINRTTDNIGLFGVFANTTVIRNLKLTNVNVTGNDNVGALVGANTSTSGGGRIDNCEAAGAVTGRSVVGGLVGKNDGPIAGSSASVAVTATATTIASSAGGLVGVNLTAPIMNSHASGNVSGSHNTDWRPGWFERRHAKRRNQHDQRQHRPRDGHRRRYRRRARRLEQRADQRQRRSQPERDGCEVGRRPGRCRTATPSTAASRPPE